MSYNDALLRALMGQSQGTNNAQQAMLNQQRMQSQQSAYQAYLQGYYEQLQCSAQNNNPRWHGNQYNNPQFFGREQFYKQFTQDDLNKIFASMKVTRKETRREKLLKVTLANGYAPNEVEAAQKILANSEE